MSDRGERLATKFEQMNDELVKTVEQCSDAEWRTVCKGEGWSVGVTCHHIASSRQVIVDLVQAIAGGQSPPALTIAQLDQLNAEHAQQYANCTKEEVLGLLRRDAPSAASVLRGLSDEQLDRAASVLEGTPPVTTEQVIEYSLIGHAARHLESIRDAP